VRVGEVTDVAIRPPEKAGDPSRVELTFFVKKGVVVRDHYTVSVRGTHIMSEPHIEITPLAGEGRVLKDGDLVPNGVSPVSLDSLIEEGRSITDRMNKILGAFAFESDETKDMVHETFQNMHGIMGAMNQILVGHEEDYEKMAHNMTVVADQLAELLDRFNKGEGTVGKLMTEDELYNDLRDFVREIKTHPWRLFKKG